VLADPYCFNPAQLPIRAIQDLPIAQKTPHATIHFAANPIQRAAENAINDAAASTIPIATARGFLPRPAAVGDLISAQCPCRGLTPGAGGDPTPRGRQRLRELQHLFGIFAVSQPGSSHRIDEPFQHGDVLVGL
jgi:hypothetical protein